MWSKPSMPFNFDECAEIGDVLDRALADVAGNHLCPKFSRACRYVRPRSIRGGKGAMFCRSLVDFLDDLEFIRCCRRNPRGSSAWSRQSATRPETPDADVDDQSAFDNGRDLALDDAAFVADGQNVVPVLFELRLPACEKGRRCLRPLFSSFSMSTSIMSPTFTDFRSMNSLPRMTPSLL